MKSRLNLFLIPLLLILNCVDRQEKKSMQVKEDDSAKTIIFKVDEPILIQDSNFIIYPLILEYAEGEKNYYSFGSSGREKVTFYSNLIFVNTTNNAYHLLDESRKMVIQFYPFPMENSKPDDPSSKFHFNKLDKWLYYSVNMDDFNGDGKINSIDPTYLFISDKSGQNFKQISPKNIDIQNWRLIKGTNKVIMEGRRDSNNNKNFDFEDELVPFSFVIGKDKEPQEIFSEEFKDRIKKKNK